MGQWTSLEVIGLALDGMAALAIVLWVVWARKRLAADTVHAREQAAQIIASAERDALSQRKETELLGKEQAHALLVDAERAAREIQDAARTSEQHIAEQLRAAEAKRAFRRFVQLDDAPGGVGADDRVRHRLQDAAFVRLDAQQPFDGGAPVEQVNADDRRGERAGDQHAQLTSGRIGVLAQLCGAGRSIGLEVLFQRGNCRAHVVEPRGPELFVERHAFVQAALQNEADHLVANREVPPP